MRLGGGGLRPLSGGDFQGPILCAQASAPGAQGSEPVTERPHPLCPGKSGGGAWGTGVPSACSCCRLLGSVFTHPGLSARFSEQVGTGKLLQNVRRLGLCSNIKSASAAMLLLRASFPPSCPGAARPPASGRPLTAPRFEPDFVLQRRGWGGLPHSQRLPTCHTQRYL